jgi:hypothetical protein
MKGNKQRNVLMLLAIIMLAAMTMMAGCSGSDGATGATGATGAKGPAGPSGPVTTTNESCMICHTTGKIADIAVAHPDPTNSDLIVTINSVDSVASGTATVARVNFHVDAKTPAGVVSNFTTLANSNQSFKIADLIPARTGTNTFFTSYFEMWVSESPGKAAGGTPPFNTPATNNIVTTDAANGNYSYTFVTPFGSAWPGYNNADHALATSERVAIELSSPPAGYNKAVGILDFTGDPGAGNSTTGIASVRQFVTIQACRKCHGPLMDGAAHANNRNDIRECDFCHSALYGSLPKHAPGFMADDNADLPVFIHGIHGSTWNDTDDQFQMGPEVTSPVTYPQELKDCTVCHSNPGGATGDLSELDNWKTHPTARVCHSCHTENIIAADGSMTHVTTLNTVISVPTGTKSAASCIGCHVGSNDAAQIDTAHDTTPTGNMVPEFDVTITLSDPANKTAQEALGYLGYFVSGETFTVNVTLKKHSDGSAVNTLFYTSPAGPKGVTSDTALSGASLYLYGPRSFQLPLTGTQSNSLFGHGDATGFHYAVTVPAGAMPGTYMARVRIADYGMKSARGVVPVDTWIESYALTAFQIGANIPAKSGSSGYPAHAAVEPKIDGNADCKLCHGDTVMHADDHAAPFDSDHCAACHDQSGGHAAYIGNRVHAIHSASATGDMVANRDWSQFVYELGKPVTEEGEFTGPTVTGPVTFPLGDISPATSTSQSTYKCVICHTPKETSGTYLTNVYETPCLGCHGDVPGADDHMLQNGGKFQ